MIDFLQALFSGRRRPSHLFAAVAVAAHPPRARVRGRAPGPHRPADAGTPEMQRVARAIRKGAMAFLRTEYLALVVFTAIAGGVILRFIDWPAAAKNLPHGQPFEFLYAPEERHGPVLRIRRLLLRPRGLHRDADRHRREREDGGGGAHQPRRGLPHRVRLRHRDGDGGRRHRPRRPHRRVPVAGLRPGQRGGGGPDHPRLLARRFLDRALRPRRRRHLHEGRRRRRRPGRQGGGGHPGGRPAQPGGDRRQRRATTWATWRAWAPTSSSPTWADPRGDRARRWHAPPERRPTLANLGYGTACPSSLLPIGVAALGILASIFGTFVVKTEDETQLTGALFRGLILASILFAGLTFGLCGRSAFSTTSSSARSPAAGSRSPAASCGPSTSASSSASSSARSPSTTPRAKRHARAIARQSETGAATNMIHGLAVGMQSTAVPVILVGAAIYGGVLLRGSSTASGSRRSACSRPSASVSASTPTGRWRTTPAGSPRWRHCLPETRDPHRLARRGGQHDGGDRQGVRHRLGGPHRPRFLHDVSGAVRGGAGRAGPRPRPPAAGRHGRAPPGRDALPFLFSALTMKRRGPRGPPWSRRCAGSSRRSPG